MVTMYIKGRKCKECTQKTQNNPVSIANQPAPFYEDVDVLLSVVEHQEQNLELKENMAYDPSKSMSVEQQ